MQIYVDAKASRQGNGTKEMPYKHINDAAKVAVAGDQILVYPGEYHENVNPINAGREDARIEYISVEPLGAVITGAEYVKDWTLYEGTTWKTVVDNGVFAGFNPFKEIIIGDWYTAPRDENGNVTDNHRGAVFMNDKMFYEAYSLEECLLGEEWKQAWYPEQGIYRWYAVVDDKTTTIYANFHDKDPRNEKVEISVRRTCFMPDKKGVGFITLSGFKVEKAATNWAPPAAYQEGMIGAHWSKGWIIEDCDISNSKCCGISLGNYHQTEKDNDNYFTYHHVKSPTQMERDAVCIAQHDGWTKETVGSHIIRRNHIYDCGQAGVVGRMGAVFSIIEDNHIHNINNTGQLAGAEVAGIKLHAAIDVTYRRNHIHHCTMGIWCDWQAQGTRITQNLLHDNCRGYRDGKRQDFGFDIFIEVSHGPTIIDNNIMLTKVSINWACQGMAVIHNLISGGFTNIGSGTDGRYTPYHIAHNCDVAGFTGFNHGDDRVYNNLIIQRFPVEVDCVVTERMGFKSMDNDRSGTFVFDEYPEYDEWIEPFGPDGVRFDWSSMRNVGRHMAVDHLPVWIDGNAYFNDARPWNREKNKFVDTENEAYVELVEKDGQLKIETNMLDLMKDFQCGIIYTDMLKKAFQPEQRFENPDGTDIIFNEDYFGDHRGVSTIPGPFADKAALEKAVF